MKKVAFHTLGCKLNFSETSTLSRMFQDLGFSKVAFDEPADIYVINTCSVTDNADKECRQVVRRALRTSPDAFIAVTGCYAQLKPDEIASMEGVDLVLGASEKFKLTDFITSLDKKIKAEVHACEIDHADFFISSWSHSDRTRAFLKVQDGCDYTCSYCTIPLARGKSRSDTVENVVRNAEALSIKGIKEIVLTGVNTGDFGKGEPTRHVETFFDLVRALDRVEGIERFRISSIEPNLLTDEIIEFVASSDKFVPHFHIPLQSGSDRILKLMRRRYLRDLYTSRVKKIKTLMPHCCIGADVIVGFPGETESDFLETYRFLNELDISYLHVFTYSERDRTDAANMDGAVPVETRKKRNKMLRILSAKKQHAFCRQFAGTERNVLFESENKNGFISGYTDNYIKVKAAYDEGLINTVVNVTLQSMNEDGTLPVIITDQTQEINT